MMLWLETTASRSSRGALLLLLLQCKLGLLLGVSLLADRGEVGGRQRVEGRLRGGIPLELLLLLLLLLWLVRLLK